MQELQVFNNNEFGQLRTINIDGKDYFVGRDIALSLGYSNPNAAILRHCKGVVKRDTPTNGGIQTLSFITEGDMYRLITHSKLPTAEKFEKWVFDEVIPSIRKHGMYATDELLDNPDLLIATATKLKEERAARLKAEEEKKRLQLENKQKDKIIGELKPKADYTDVILKSKSLVTITQIAKDYGMSGQEMNSLLHELKVQYKLSDQWLLYSKYHNEGYTHSETIPIKHKNGRLEPKMNTKWTQKGRLFLYELLKENGVLPVIEREDM